MDSNGAGNTVETHDVFTLSSELNCTSSFKNSRSRGIALRVSTTHNLELQIYNFLSVLYFQKGFNEIVVWQKFQFGS